MVGKKKASNRLIGDIKFSPNQKYLALACSDTKIYVYSMPKLERQCVLQGSTASVTHLDWSLDSKSLHTNDTSYEILFYNVESGQRDPGGASSYRDEFWHSWNLILGWPV